MLTFFVVFLVILVMIGMEWKEMNPKKNKRNFWIFASFLSIGIVLWILKGFEVEIGNPIIIMQKLTPYLDINR